MTGLRQDVRFAARVLRRSPGFTLTAIVLLALGIGANGAIFSLLDAALLRPLPFREPDRLAMLWERSPNFPHNRVSPLNFLDWSEQQRTFASIAAVAGGSRTLTGLTAAAERIPGQSVTTRFFDVLGVGAIAGRTFDPDDARTNPHVVVISDRLWRSRFGREPGIVGRPLVLDGEPFTVIGVVPAEFQILFRADLWTLFVPRRTPEQRMQHYLQVIGRLQRGVTIEQASAEMAGVAAGIARISPDTNKDWGVTIEPLRNAVVGADLRATTVMLACAVALVLLIACANVANLLLARGLNRAGEIAIRAAIGASRGRIVVQLIVESLVLALIGGAAGALLASTAVRLAPSWLPPDTLPQSVALRFDARIVAFAVLLSIVTALACGLVPAWHVSTPSTVRGARGATRAAGAARSALVVAEVAAAIVLLTGAGLLTRTLLAIDRADYGFQGDHVLTGAVGLPLRGYDDLGNLLTFYQKAERELASIPGVTVAAIGDTLPLDGWNIGQGFEIVGDPPLDRSKKRAAHYQIVSSDYFRALGIALLKGRPFTPHDTAQTQPVCIVNEEFVRRYLNGRDPLQARVSVPAMAYHGRPTDVVRQIVGVIRQVGEAAGEKEPAIEIYVPIEQNAWFSASVVLRTAVDPLSLAPAMKAAIARVDPNLPVTRIRTMDEVAAESSSQQRLRAELVGAFAAIAVVLAAAGIFGALTYSVWQRSREFGIRLALGAQTTDVLGMVFGAALKLTVAGMAIGLAAAALLTRFLESLLFHVRPIDPPTFFVTAAIVSGVAVAASVLPALHASRVDPAVILRRE
ncbi:MAG TPA: ABC transporter permease [Vicinamibacterales bacterium]|jgi:putative ABC transport system permease protein|nr:ABC transporter permease [Vicinamibacterales bacterium]